MIKDIPPSQFANKFRGSIRKNLNNCIARVRFTVYFDIKIHRINNELDVTYLILIWITVLSEPQPQELLKICLMFTKSEDCSLNHKESI